jgi:1-acyl-sn-glycerol-3-phosphate acyltransferase
MQDDDRSAGVRRWLDTAIGGLCRLVMSVFFREVEVVGVDHVPAGAPLLVVGNHTNALIDPVLLAGYLPMLPRLLAKSTLWNSPWLAPLLGLGGAIPVYRRQDAALEQQSGQHMARNEDMFARCHDALAAGGAVALFPEGISHNEPRLMPLKTGVARIALEAETNHPGIGIRILPVGLIYDARSRFRSRALVHIGEPIDPSRELAQYQQDPPAAVSRLTERVSEALASVTPNYANWEEARLAQRAAEIMAYDPVHARDTELPLSKQVALSRALAAGYRRLLELDPAEVATVYEEVRSYDRLLRVFKLRTRQLTSPYRATGVAWLALRTLGLLLIRLPLTLIGLVLNYPTYRIIGAVATRMARKDPDVEATYKVFVGFFLFPMTWLAEAIVLGWWLGITIGWLVLLGAPLTAWVAMRSHDRRQHLLTEVRAFFLLRNNRRIANELAEMRTEIRKEIERLAARLNDGGVTSADSHAR